MLHLQEGLQQHYLIPVRGVGRVVCGALDLERRIVATCDEFIYGAEPARCEECWARDGK